MDESEHGDELPDSYRSKTKRESGGAPTKAAIIYTRSRIFSPSRPSANQRTPATNERTCSKTPTKIRWRLRPCCKDVFPRTPIKNINLEDLLTLHECKHYMDSLGGNADTDVGSRYMIVMRILLTEALSHYGPVLPKPYIQFAELLRPNDIVMTFNWDTILEEALRQVGKPYRFMWGGNQIKVLKMHGSVDWKRLRRCDLHRFQIRRHRIRGSLYQFPDLDDAVKRRRAPVEALGIPYIVLPSFAKLQWLETLRDYWYKIAAAPSNATSITIIGYSLRSDDYHTRSFLIPGLSSFIYRNKRTIKIIDRNPDVVSNYNFLPVRRFDHYKGDFDSDSVEWLMERLKGTR